jgi:hypothetical protein
MLEVLKQALEALEKSNRFVWHYAHSKATARIAEQCDEAITSLRKAIQEEALRNVQRIGQEIEQEPIANLEIVDLGDGNKHFDNHWLSDLRSLPCGDYLLYTHPPQRTWVGLTDKEIMKEWLKTGPSYPIPIFARAIEAKLKEKNT